MKKTIGGIIILGSLVLLNSGCSKTATLVNYQELSAKGVEEINIDYDSDVINIYENDGNMIRVEEYLMTAQSKGLATINQGDKSIQVKSGERTDSWFVLNDNSHIDVYLPRDYKNKLDIKIKSGTVTVREDLNLSDFVCESSSGDLGFKSIKAESIQLSTTSGSIKSNHLASKKSQLTSTSGSINLGDVNSNELAISTTSGSIKISKLNSQGTIKATSGSIKLEEVIGQADLSTTSGSIKSNFKKVNGAISAEATSGSIQLTLPKKLAFNFLAKVNSGSIKTDFDHDLNNDGGDKKGSIGSDPELVVSTQTTSGSIKVFLD